MKPKGNACPRVCQRVILGVNHGYDYPFILRSAEFEAAMRR
jgi:hypothetical protein